MSESLGFYPQVKLDALANFLSVDVDTLRVWSDSSITVGDADNVDYFVSRRLRKSGKLLGTQDGYYIYQSE